MGNRSNVGPIKKGPCSLKGIFYFHSLFKSYILLGSKRLPKLVEQCMLIYMDWRVRVWFLPTSFLIQKQRGGKYRTKSFPCCYLFILYLLRFSPSTRFSPFIQLNKCQLFLFSLSSSTLSLCHFFKNLV